jgi:hypothetical protein
MKSYAKRDLSLKACSLLAYRNDTASRSPYRVKRIWLSPGPQTVRVHWNNTVNATAASRRSSEVV